MTYKTIVADPPWEYKEFCQIHSVAGRVTKPLPYNSMTIEEICSLQVGKFFDVNSRLFLWTTNKYLPSAFTVITKWGFEYKQTLIWHKVGNPSPWGGSVAPNHAEFLLVATKGKPKRLSLLRSNVISCNVGRHSRKPEIFMDLIEQISPPAYLELFARTKRLGWAAWGNEVDCDIDLPPGPQ